jgi:hypothetical protein
MTNRQINIAIAELRGWRFVDNDPDYEPYWEDPNGTKVAVNFIEHRVPNCAGCLNAMHEAEKMLTGKQRIIYADQLCILWTGLADRPVPMWFWITEATARQRAESFLRTLGKWEEEE